jgi:hypothetical protein
MAQLRAALLILRNYDRTAVPMAAFFALYYYTECTLLRQASKL